MFFKCIGYDNPGVSPVIANWDFTSESLVDTINGYTLDNHNATLSSSGLSFTINSVYVNIPLDLLGIGRAYEIDFGTMTCDTSSNNNRVFGYRYYSSDSATHANCGLYFKGSSGKWAVYDETNSVQESTISDPNYFSNSTMRIEIGNDGKWKIYRNGKLVFAPPLALPITPRVFCFGSEQYPFYNMVIKKFRIYELTKCGALSAITFKKYAYISGSSVGIDFIGGGYIGKLTSNLIGEVYIKFRESEFKKNGYLYTSASYGPSIRVISPNNTDQYFRIFYSNSSSSSYEDIAYSTGEHEVIIDRYPDNKCIFDGTELEHTFVETNTRYSVCSISGSSNMESNPWKGYLEEIRLKDRSGNVIVDMLPCEYDGKACFYDRVGQYFYYYYGMSVMDEIPTT